LLLQRAFASNSWLFAAAAAPGRSIFIITTALELQLFDTFFLIIITVYWL
jgi:hypothetical protein